MNRLAFSQGHELEPHGATAVAITPGWLRSEMMLENFGVDRGELARRARRAADGDRRAARLRAVRVAALRRARRRRAGVGSRPGPLEPAVGHSGQLAQDYGFTDLDGSQPDVWRFIEEVREPVSTPTPTTTADPSGS